MSFKEDLPYAFIYEIRRTKTCFKFYIKCPYCKDTHTHGGGLLDAPRAKPIFGTRMSHCGKGEYILISEIV